MPNERTEAVKRFKASFRHALGEQLLAFLDDDDVIEIMCNPDGQVYIDTMSKGQQVTPLTLSPKQTDKIITLVLDQSSEPGDSVSIATEFPFVRARFQGMLPPIAAGPMFAIRKHLSHGRTLEQYLEAGEITPVRYDRILAAVKSRENILVVGGTSSGKTTLLNAILRKMVEHNPSERFVVIEDSREIYIEDARNVVYLLTCKEKGITAQSLLMDTLRLRPDRIIIGELRDRVALDFLKSMNTGHDGCISTIHASSSTKALNRFLRLIQESGVNITGMREDIADTLNLIVFLKRVAQKGGYQKRMVTEVLESKGYDQEKGYLVKPC